MSKYLKLFKTHQEYETYSVGEMILPNVSYCEDQNDVHYNPWSWAKEYLTFVAKESGTFTFTPKNSNVISYSTDGGETWTTGNSVSVSNGDKVMWKGTMTPSLRQGVGQFSSTGNFDVQGNIMSLLYGDNYKKQTDLTGKDYAFYQLFYKNTKVVNAENLSIPATTLAQFCYTTMFQGCTSLVNAPQLPATTLVDYCYSGMFRGCTSLVNTPELPATTLALQCYKNMFYDCTSLVNAPELPATTLAKSCYQFLFTGCTSLTTAPELPVTTLVEECYNNMFNGCTSLTTAPELPATTLAKDCYSSMFSGCANLTTAPELPATTMAQYCYQYMFQNCTNIVTAPELPATTLAYYCYSGMFNGCTKLNYIKAMFTTTPSTNYTKNWVNGVSASGTFVKNSTAQWNVSGVNGIPTGWTVETATA